MKHLVVFACIFLFFSSPIVAEEPFSVGSELTKPGVKLVVLEFYASYCMPCRKAVPQWNLLHQKYRAKGLRFVVITVDEEGGCTNPGWSPDRVICDKDRYWQKRYGVEKLPQAFLYTWQGELISERTHVEQVEQAIVRFFTDTQLRMTVDQPEVLGDKCALGSNPEWVRDYVVGQLGRGSKFDVLDEATKALPKMTEAGQCSVFFPPNSNLRIRLVGDCEGNRTLNLTLEKDGCVLASSQQPYKGKGMKEDQDSLKWAAREAAGEVLAAVTKVKMPAAMAIGKPSGKDWIEEPKVVEDRVMAPREPFGNLQSKLHALSLNPFPEGKPNSDNQTSQLPLQGTGRCVHLSYGEYSDWRLPTIDELKTLLDESIGETKSPTFPDMPAISFWSSSRTDNARTPYHYWRVHLVFGAFSDDYMESVNAVRCVRP